MTMRSSDAAFKRRMDRAYARRLRIARLALNISEAEAAAAHGITLRTYRRWEAGLPQGASTWPVLKFAKAYDISLDWLIGGDGRWLKVHMTKQARGKIAILPTCEPERRRRLAVQS